MSEEGKDLLKGQIALFHLDIPTQKDYNIEDKKIGEDYVVSKPKTTISDLLR